MGKKKEKVEAVDAIPIQTEEEEDMSGDNDIELLQVDVGDMMKLKQILDETVASTVLDHIEEDYRLDNAKLALMSTACLFACFAQFAPIPFPDSRPVLGACCCLYFLLSGILQLITTFIDKDCILLTKPSADTKDKNLKQYGIRVRSDLPRFSEYYTITLEFQNMPNSPCVEQKWSVGRFFDVEGMFDELGLMEAVKDVYQRLNTGNYDNDGKMQLSKKKTE